MRATLFLIDSVSLPKYDTNEFSVGVFGVRDTLLPTEKCVLIQEEMLTPSVLLPNNMLVIKRGPSPHIAAVKGKHMPPPFLTVLSVDDKV